MIACFSNQIHTLTLGENMCRDNKWNNEIHLFTDSANCIMNLWVGNLHKWTNNKLEIISYSRNLMKLISFPCFIFLPPTPSMYCTVTLTIPMVSPLLFLKFTVSLLFIFLNYYVHICILKHKYINKICQIHLVILISIWFLGWPFCIE